MPRLECPHCQATVPAERVDGGLEMAGEFECSCGSRGCRSCVDPDVCRGCGQQAHASCMVDVSGDLLCPLCRSLAMKAAEAELAEAR